MPVTKTAKRALRVSKRRKAINSKLLSKIEIALRVAKKSNKDASKKLAQSLLDKAAKSHLFHKNKSSRLKSSLFKSQ